MPLLKIVKKKIWGHRRMTRRMVQSNYSCTAWEFLQLECLSTKNCQWISITMEITTPADWNWHCPSISMTHSQFWSAIAKAGFAFIYFVVCFRVMSHGSEDDVLCCVDSEAFSTPPRFSTIRLNILDKESDSVEDDLKDYLKKVSYMSGWKVRFLSGGTCESSISLHQVCR